MSAAHVALLVVVVVLAGLLFGICLSITADDKEDEQEAAS